MKNLFRQPNPGPSGYLALLVFAVAYLGTMATVIVPDRVAALLDTTFAIETH